MKKNFQKIMFSSVLFGALEQAILNECGKYFSHNNFWNLDSDEYLFIGEKLNLGLRQKKQLRP